jgi:hypothetical protein
LVDELRAGTVSKILGAGFRLGWLCAPREMIPVFQSFLFGGGVNPFASRVATYFLRDHLAPHVALLVDAYRAKRDAMLRGLWEVLEGTDVEVSRPEGGFFLWIRLPTGTGPARLAELSGRAGVQYTAGPAFFPNGGGERFIRLAYSPQSAATRAPGSWPGPFSTPRADRTAPAARGPVAGPPGDGRRDGSRAPAPPQPGRTVRATAPTARSSARPEALPGAAGRLRPEPTHIRCRARLRPHDLDPRGDEMSVPVLRVHGHVIADQEVRRRQRRLRETRATARTPHLGSGHQPDVGRGRQLDRPLREPLAMLRPRTHLFHGDDGGTGAHRDDRPRVPDLSRGVPRGRKKQSGQNERSYRA